MSINSTLFAFALVDTAALLFLSIYILITLSDLECDYLNTTQCSNKLSKWIIPEVIAFGTNILLILLANRWFLLFINLLMFAYIVYKFFLSMSYGSLGFYDSSKIYVRENLRSHIKFVFIRLVFYLVHFFIYLYLFIIYVLTSS